MPDIISAMVSGLQVQKPDEPFLARVRLPWSDSRGNELVNEHPERPTANPSDELLAIRCQLGERDAFDELIERYADRLRGYVRRFSNQASETDDLVQDIWLRVLRALPGLREPARLRALDFLDCSSGDRGSLALPLCRASSCIGR